MFFFVPFTHRRFGVFFFVPFTHRRRGCWRGPTGCASLWFSAVFSWANRLWLCHTGQSNPCAWRRSRCFNLEAASITGSNRYRLHVFLGSNCPRCIWHPKNLRRTGWVQTLSLKRAAVGEDLVLPNAWHWHSMPGVDCQIFGSQGMSRDLPGTSPCIVRDNLVGLLVP